MTTTTIDTRQATQRSSWSAITAVVRLQFTNPWTVVIIPWLIMAAILIMNVAIWWMISSNIHSAADLADARDGTQYSGAVIYAFVYMMVVAVQAINGYFPFALGYGATRRNYYLGTALSFILLSAFYSVGLSLLAFVEEVTHGWGVGATMFTPAYLGDTTPQRLFVYFTILMFFFFVGSAVASVFVRWKALGMTVFFVGLAFLLVGFGALVTVTESWGAVGDWFAANGLLGTYAWTLVPTALAAIFGYLILRRATPRN